MVVVTTELGIILIVLAIVPYNDDNDEEAVVGMPGCLKLIGIEEIEKDHYVVSIDITISDHVIVIDIMVPIG